MFPVPTPPASVAPAHVKLLKPSASVMRFPPAPLVVAVTVTTPAADVAVTPTPAPFRTIAAARFAATIATVALF